MRKHYTCLYHSAEHSDDVCKKSCEVGNGALEENDTDGPAAAKLSPDAGDGGNARRVQQAEDEHAECGKRCHDGSNASSEQNLKRRDHTLLGHKAGDECGDDPPVAEAERGKERSQETGDHGHQAVRGVGDIVKRRPEALQKPDDNGGEQDDGECLLQEIS